VVVIVVAVAPSVVVDVVVGTSLDVVGVAPYAYWVVVDNPAHIITSICVAYVSAGASSIVVVVTIATLMLVVVKVLELLVMVVLLQLLVLILPAPIWMLLLMR